MSEAEALAGLRRSESKLRAYGERHGLVLREESPWPGYVPASQQPGSVKHAVWSLAGVLPGGAIGRLRHQAVFGTTAGIDVAMQHTVMICRIPESVGYVPFLGCRPAGLGGAMYAWDNDQRRKRSQLFESVELERRYRVEVAADQSQNEGSIAWLEFSSIVDIEHEYIAVAVPTDADLPTIWVDPEDVGAPGVGAELPAAAVEAATASGYGISTSPRSACVYIRTGGATLGAEIDRFAGTAQRIIALLEPSP